MKPWGSQPTISTLFQSVTYHCQSPRRGPQSLAPPDRSSRATEKMASGGPGGGNEPPGRRHGCGEILTRTSIRLPRIVSVHFRAPSSERRLPNRLPGTVAGHVLWVALDYASCGAACLHLPVICMQVMGPMAPAQLSQYARRPFVTDSLRPTSQVLTHFGSPCLGSTKLRADAAVPKRTTSADRVRNQESVTPPCQLRRGCR